jgi:hypothetical protein
MAEVERDLKETKEVAVVSEDSSEEDCSEEDSSEEDVL